MLIAGTTAREGLGRFVRNMTEHSIHYVRGSYFVRLKVKKCDVFNT